MWEIVFEIGLRQAANLLGSIPPHQHDQAAEIIKGWLDQLTASHGADHPIVAAFRAQSPAPEATK
jgi:hypothetical protein